MPKQQHCQVSLFLPVKCSANTSFQQAQPTALLSLSHCNVDKVFSSKCHHVSAYSPAVVAWEAPQALYH